jgi:pyridoxamine 5'-phosphate oxidase
MVDTYFKELKSELENGAEDKSHPFRYFTLATMGVDQYARLRTVVLRATSSDLLLTFYTDKRSKKITHIKENKKVSLLFYNPKKLLQVRIEGVATILTDKSKLDEVWKNIQENSKKEYSIASEPGSTISNPDNLDYLDGINHFCMVQIEPFKIEYLKLRRPNHLRIRFWREIKTWEGEFLVP